MLMSKSAYAIHRGVSRQTVYDWESKGDLILVGKKIDVEATAEKLGITKAAKRPELGESIEITWRKLVDTMLSAPRPKAPARKYADVMRRLSLAANAIGFSIEPWGGGFRLYAGSDSDFDSSGYYIEPNSNNNPELDTLDCIRGLIFSFAIEDPNGETEITQDELSALCEPLIAAR